MFIFSLWRVVGATCSDRKERASERGESRSRLRFCVLYYNNRAQSRQAKLGSKGIGGRGRGGAEAPQGRQAEAKRRVLAFFLLSFSGAVRRVGVGVGVDSSLTPE